MPSVMNGSSAAAHGLRTLTGARVGPISSSSAIAEPSRCRGQVDSTPGDARRYQRPRRRPLASSNSSSDSIPESRNDASLTNSSAMLIVPSPAEAGAGDGASLGDQVPQPGDASVDRLPAAGDRYRVLRLVRVRVALTPIAARLTCLPRPFE